MKIPEYAVTLARARATAAAATSSPRRCRWPACIISQAESAIRNIDSGSPVANASRIAGSLNAQRAAANRAPVRPIRLEAVR